jgi:hypothetical protein
MSSHTPRRSPRGLCLASCLLAAVAVLGSPVRAWDEPYPAEITPPASVVILPTTLVIDDSFPMTKGAKWPKFWHDEQELRLRKERQADDENEEESTEVSTNTKSQSPTRTAQGNEEGTATAHGNDEGEDEDEDAPQTTPTPTEDEGEDEDEDNGTTTLTVSLTPSTTDPIPSNSPLPSPFDDTLVSEFNVAGGDDSCPNFMNVLLNDATFKDCYPLSMMFRVSSLRSTTYPSGLTRGIRQTSMGFFNARKSLVATTRVLDATCDADLETCSQFMSAAAANLTAEENCGEEFETGLAKITEAYRGLMAYETLYTVSCLQDPDTNGYCFANAVTNTSIPSDANLYFLPYNLNLPGSSSPTCNWCNQETMALFHAASADRDQLISNTYESAARQVNNICGPEFVNETLPEPERSFGRTFPPSWSIMSVSVCVGAAMMALL